MKPYTRDALTGLTAVAGVLGLAALLMLFGELRGLREKYYTFNLQLDSARGLLTGGPITINGVRSGRVAEVRGATDPTRGVELVLELREGVNVPAGFEVYIDRSLIGDATLELTPVIDPALSGRYVAPGETVERKALTMMDEIAAKLAEPIDAIKLTARNVDTLTATYDEVGQRVSDLLAPRTLAEVEAGAPANMTSAVARLDAAVASADEWLGDDQLRTDARDLVSSASGVLSDASDAVQKWESAAESVELQVGKTGDQLAEVSTRLNSTLDSVGGTAEEARVAVQTLNSREGTLGMLLANPDLYRSLQSAAERLERTLAEAQLLIEKYRKEGVPIRF